MADMLCESCNLNPATVHLTEITNKGKKDLHLCEECAKEKGVSFKSPHFSISDLLGGLVETTPEPEKSRGQKMVCKGCGLSFAEFKASGRLGCPKCYDAFAKGLVPLLNKIHQADRHVGRVPRRRAQHQAGQKELLDLRRDLDEAVKTEQYEKAAALRDQITRMETSLTGKEGDEPPPAPAESS